MRPIIPYFGTSLCRLSSGVRRCSDDAQCEFVEGRLLDSMNPSTEGHQYSSSVSRPSALAWIVGVDYRGIKQIEKMLVNRNPTMKPWMLQ